MSAVGGGQPSRSWQLSRVLSLVAERQREGMLAHTQPRRYFGSRITPFRDLTHRVALKIFAEIRFAHDALLASKLGKKASTNLAAIQVVSGSGPNLFSELNGSMPRTGFPDPDLFDHFAHMGRRRSHTSVTGSKPPCATSLSCSSSLCRILIILTLDQHGPNRSSHFVCKRDGHKHSWFPGQHSR